MPPGRPTRGSPLARGLPLRGLLRPGPGDLRNLHWLRRRPAHPGPRAGRREALHRLCRWPRRLHLRTVRSGSTTLPPRSLRPMCPGRASARAPRRRHWPHPARIPPTPSSSFSTPSRSHGSPGSAATTSSTRTAKSSSGSATHRRPFGPVRRNAAQLPGPAAEHQDRNQPRCPMALPRPPGRTTHDPGSHGTSAPPPRLPDPARTHSGNPPTRPPGPRSGDRQDARLQRRTHHPDRRRGRRNLAPLRPWGPCTMIRTRRRIRRSRHTRHQTV